MAQINFKSIRVKVATAPKARKEAYALAKQVFDERKEQLLEEYENNLVTQELKEGESAENISSTLGGYGNLFSFIGFFQGDEPTEIIAEMFEKIRLNKQALFSSFVKGGGLEMGFRVINIPTLDEIYEKTPYPDGWRDGSWAKGIERGIPGLESYLYDEEFDTYAQSRSTTGLQAKDGSSAIVIIRKGNYRKPEKYISDLLKEFNKNLK